jgi:hypothetical protein
MAKMIARIMDDRYSGLAFEPLPPVVAPMLLRYKWRPWRAPISAWGVVQPKREVVGASVSWVWRHIAVFTRKKDADQFLAELD